MRYNVFNQIHKALRGMLYDAAISIQRTDFTTDEAGATVDKLEQLLKLFDEHAAHEDEYILPHIARHDAKLVESFEQDHVVDHRLAAALFANVNDWRNMQTSAQRHKIGQQIFYGFNEFIAFNLYHMNREENELLLVLWKHYSDMEIHGMEQQILQSIAPETLQIESLWMVRMLSNTEIIDWFRGVQMHAPAPVLEGLMGLAKAEIPEARYRLIISALTEDAVPA